MFRHQSLAVRYGSVGYRHSLDAGISQLVYLIHMFNRKYGVAMTTRLVAALILGTGLLAACGGRSHASGDAPLRLGFFPNITHATALVGVEKGIFAKHLGRAPKTLTF